MRALAVAALAVVGGGAPSPVGGQTAADDPPPARIRPRLEIGGGAGVAVAFPEVNALASLPIAVRLALAGATWAQEAPAPGRADPPPIEIGGTVGAFWFEPTVGILASARTSRRSSIEAGASITPAFVLTQAQARVRLPIGPPGGARRSLVVGLTHVSRRAGTIGTALDPGDGGGGLASVSRRANGGRIAR